MTLHKVGTVLRPSDDESAELLRKIAPGQPMRWTVHPKRNVRQHRLYWALVNLAHDNLPEDIAANWPTPELLSDGIKMACGLVEPRLNPKTGDTFLKLKSIAFDEMDQLEFQTFFEMALEVIATKLIPGVDLEAIRGEAMDAAA